MKLTQNEENADRPLFALRVAQYNRSLIILCPWTISWLLLFNLCRAATLLNLQFVLLTHYCSLFLSSYVMIYLFVFNYCLR